MTHDPTFKKWPDDVLKLYGQLQLPSLYEFILSNERVAAEVRRQNTDIHKLFSALVDLKEQVKVIDDRFQMDLVDLSAQDRDESSETPLSLPPSLNEQEDEQSENTSSSGYYPAWEVDMMRQANKLEQRQWEEIYVAMLEVINQVFIENESTFKQMLSMLSQSKTAKATVIAIDSLASQHNNKMLSIKDQMLAHLKDIDMEPIIPQQGELYDEDIHRVIETVTSTTKGSKSKRNTIARVIRIGYKRHGELVRQADVCVYG